MAKYHVLASKEVKPCNENKCRAKYGSFDSKKAADSYVRKLKTGKATGKPDPEVIIPDVVIPEEVVQDKATEVETSEEAFEPAITVEDVEDFIAEVAPEAQGQPDNYFEDDEVFLKTKDIVLNEQDGSGLFKQDDQTISFEILNFYDDRGRPLSKYAIKRNPPILQLNSSSFEYPIEMVLTENFARAISKQTSDVYRRYYGLEPKKENAGKMSEIREWLEANPIKAVLLGVLLIAFVLLAFII